MLHLLTVTTKNADDFVRLFNKIFSRSHYPWFVFKNNELDFKNFLCFFVRHNSETAGVLILRKTPKYLPTQGVVSEIGVLKKYQRKGIGSLVLKKAEKILKQLGFSTALVEIMPYDDLIHFLTANKFNIVGIKYRTKCTDGKTRLVAQEEFDRLSEKNKVLKSETWLYMEKNLN